MNGKFGLLAICFLLIFGVALFSLNLKQASAAQTVGGKTLVLYDAASGTIPAAQTMNFLGFPSDAAVPKYENGTTMLDTTTAGTSTYAGWVSSGATTTGFPILNRAEGFQVDFTLQMENESHENNDRAGFSIIILSDDAKGIELAFWEDEIWAQHDDTTGELFRHGEGTTFSNTTGQINYRVIILGDGYTLTADGSTILSGPLRDYTRFEGFPDPYQTPNFLFLGDDTTSAQAGIRLSYVSVTGKEYQAPATSPSASSSPTPSVNPTPALSPTAETKDFQPCAGGLLLLAVMAIARFSVLPQ